MQNRRKHPSPPVKRRIEHNADRVSTKIWHERPCEHNPYIAEQCLCHGYDFYDLIQQRSFVDVFYLLFRGELPGLSQSHLLETLMTGLINPGPRHNATRAAVQAGVGKTHVEHILPIALSIMGGEHLGAGEVESSMRFLRKASKRDPQQEADQLLAQLRFESEADNHIVAGFGSRYGDIDQFAKGIAQQLINVSGQWPTLSWAAQFVKHLEAHNMGWLMPGLAAATFCDLGFQPRMGPGIFQLLTAPGLLAHGVEYANKPTTDLPSISDEDYVID